MGRLNHEKIAEKFSKAEEEARRTAERNRRETVDRRMKTDLRIRRWITAQLPVGLQLVQPRPGDKIWRRVDVDWTVRPDALSVVQSKRICDHLEYDASMVKTDRGSYMFRVQNGEMDLAPGRLVAYSRRCSEGAILFLQEQPHIDWTHIVVEKTSSRDSRGLTIFGHAVVGPREELLAQYGLDRVLAGRDPFISEE